MNTIGSWAYQMNGSALNSLNSQYQRLRLNSYKKTRVKRESHDLSSIYWHVECWSSEWLKVQSSELAGNYRRRLEMPGDVTGRGRGTGADGQRQVEQTCTGSRPTKYHVIRLQFSQVTGWKKKSADSGDQSTVLWKSKRHLSLYDKPFASVYHKLWAAVIS